MSSILVRFAPSPTGYLHVGNIRTALVNWLYAKKAGGRFFLRLDDTDSDRSKPEYEAALEEDLRWLGLEWAEKHKQSERRAAYRAAEETLIKSGRLYPCYETQEELEVRRKLQAARGLPPVYDRAALALTPADHARFDEEGRKPHYRFLLHKNPVVWHDMIRGEVKFEGAHVSDPVLVREDGVPLYTLASVVDDIDMHVTTILRGEDHVSNTFVQFQIFEALGAAPPQFGHLALLKTPDGELSKRVGGHDIRGLRESGLEAMAINSLLAKLGTSDAVAPYSSLEALVDAFDITHFGRAPANYDAQELQRLNARLLSQLPFALVAERLRGLGLDGADARFWLSVRGNLQVLRDAKDWWEVLHTPPTLPPSPEDAAFLALAAQHLPAAPWSETMWDDWTQGLKAASGRKGKALFLPLRLAITGREHGPELRQLLPLLGYDATRARLLKGV